MPFPNVHRQTLRPEYPRIEKKTDATDLTVQVNRLCNILSLPDQPALRAGSVVYLGLCVLRNYSQNRNQDVGRTRCEEILERYNPGNGTNSVNASCFIVDEGKSSRETAKSWIDHGKAIQMASGIYMPGIKARAKRQFVMLVLGARIINSDNDEFSKEIIPADDTWLLSFRF